MMSYDSICQPEHLGLTAFPNRVNFTMALKLCKSVNGQLAYPKSADEENQIFDIITPFNSCSSK